MIPEPHLPITSFTGDYRFLSNFYPSVVVFGRADYPTVEHAYQAAKTSDDSLRSYIRLAPSPGVAKRMGRELTIRPEWEGIKLEVMKLLLLQKFHVPGFLKGRLVATGKAELIEGNPWGDTYWGVCKGVGQNHLGRLLMEIRGQLKPWQ